MAPMKRFVQFKSWIIHKNFSGEDVAFVRTLRGIIVSESQGYVDVVWSNGHAMNCPEKWLEPATMNTQLRICMGALAESELKAA